MSDWVCHSFKRFIPNISILIIYLFKLRPQTGQRKIGQKASNPTKQQYVSEPTAIRHLCPLMIFYSAILLFVSKGEKPSIMTVLLIQRAFVESNWLRSAVRWPLDPQLFTLSVIDCSRELYHTALIAWKRRSIPLSNQDRRHTHTMHHVSWESL